VTPHPSTDPSGSLEIAVLGAGAWGTAFASSAAARHRVRLWARDAAQVASMNAARENARYLPGVALAGALRAEAALDTAVGGAHVLVSAVPSAALLSTLAGLPPECRRLPLAWLSKGFVAGDDGGVRLPHQAIAGCWTGPFAVLSGPSFAIEVARGLPTAVTAAAPDLDTARWFARVFRRESFRVYATDDMVGVEVGGAVKNVLAIAAGISDGLGFGHNARAALITRGLAETGRLSKALGGRRETLMGLSGLGDIVLTCTGDLSRNRRLGMELARGTPLPAILEGLGHVAEGVPTAQRVAALADSLGLDMPICRAVHQVVLTGKDPRLAVGELLRREPGAEGA
jgi:glycerol-3-phosphate dehydrogenase (NAD(P)+)